MLASSSRRKALIPLTFGGVITAFGIALGDLSTSILYAFKAVTIGQGGTLDRTQVIGLLSLILWMLILCATVKYSIVIMRADNKGEGGVFAMFSLVRKYWKFMPIIAIIGGAFLLADSVITPANSILSAVEGLASIDAIASSGSWSQELAIMLSIAIIVLLFSMQHSGTGKVGGFFGPIMIVYLLFSGGIGLSWLMKDASILQALNPVNGIMFFLGSSNKAGIAVLSGVFLAITGAEALSADQGQLGRSNVRVAWFFAFIAIMLSYFGQGAYLLQSAGTRITADGNSPYFLMVPEALRPVAVMLALLAGVVASQALITASFSLASAADGLGWLPRLKVSYTGSSKGQVYIPSVNAALCVMTIILILFFKTSSAMEAAYGLALIVAMLMDTIMLWWWFAFVREKTLMGSIVCFVFGMIELMFLAANASKFIEGGYVTVLIAIAMMMVLYISMKGQRMELNRRRRIHADKLADMLALSTSDDKIDLTADNLVYLTPDMNMNDIEKDVAASMVHHRAHAYWVVSMVQSDSPYACEYSVKSYDGILHRVRIRLGYKQPQYYLQAYMRRIMKDMLKSKELKKIVPSFPELASKSEKAGIGTVKYVLMHRVISPESELPDNDKIILRVFQMLKRWMSHPVEWFGLETSNPMIETVSLFRGAEPELDIKRIKPRAKKNAVNDDNADTGSSHLMKIVRKMDRDDASIVDNAGNSQKADDVLVGDETIVMNPLKWCIR